jgi:hypothetical protein
LFAGILAILLTTTGCLNVLAYKSKIEIIGEGKGTRAAGFKEGTYIDPTNQDDPKPMIFTWDEKQKEYEIRVDDSKPNRFRLMRLKKKYYLLQAYNENEDNYEYAVIKISGDTFDFLNIKEDYEEKLENLLKKYHLTVNEDDEITGTKKGMKSFFKKLVKAKYLESGIPLKYKGE